MVNLSKGGNVSLEKADPGIKKVIVGLGWDPRATAGEQFDLDELRGYSYTTTATFVEAKEEEAQDDSAQ